MQFSTVQRTQALKSENLGLTLSFNTYLASDLSLSLLSLKQKHDTKYFTRCFKKL